MENIKKYFLQLGHYVKSRDKKFDLDVFIGKIEKFSEESSNDLKDIILMLKPYLLVNSAFTRVITSQMKFIPRGEVDLVTLEKDLQNCVESISEE